MKRADRVIAACLGIAAVCLALNLLSPVIIGAQRTLAPGTMSMTFDGPTGTLTRTIELTKTPKGLDALVRIDDSVADHFPINPSSHYPAMLPGQPHRDGLGPLLPYAPERRTYPLFDHTNTTTNKSVPMDYVGTGSVAGLETYKYTARLADCTRDVDVERRTGRIVSEVFSCGDGQWVLTESSRSEQLRAAERDVRVLKALQVMAVLTRFVGAAAFVAALVAYARR